METSQEDIQNDSSMDPNLSSKEAKIIKNEPEIDLVYGLTASPPWHLTALLGMQHYLTMVGSTIAIPLILTPTLCMSDDDPTRATFISTILIVSGICTLIQTTFGVRLPIVQGASFTFLVPIITILSASFPSCDQYNFTNMTEDDRREVWQVRIREIQGDIMVASLFQTIIGFTGLIGFLLTWITPLTIAPTITLIGLSLYETAALKSQGNWAIAILTIALLIAFSQYLTEWSVPLLTYTKSEGIRKAPFKIFKLFPVLLAIVLVWILCAILTYYNIFAPNSSSRTDVNFNVLSQAPWFYVPYPFQWGLPTVTVGGVFGIFTGVLASTMESIGDYYACGRLSGAPPPPKHAINRGIGMEGIGCIIAGMFGSGTCNTSYSENIGAIRVTKVASRSVIQTGAAIMILFGVFGKFGGLFVTLPDPVLGGLLFVMFSFITAVGLSNLQYVNLNSSRNLFTLGFSLFVGLALPHWLRSNPGVMQVGSAFFDQVIVVLLSTPMIVGGVVGLVLDNTIPGTPEERGLDEWKRLVHSEEGDEKGTAESSVYDLPKPLDAIFKRWIWCARVPFSTTYKPTVTKKTSQKLRKILRNWRRSKKIGVEVVNDSSQIGA